MPRHQPRHRLSKHRFGLCAQLETNRVLIRLSCHVDLWSHTAKHVGNNKHAHTHSENQIERAGARAKPIGSAIIAAIGGGIAGQTVHTWGGADGATFPDGIEAERTYFKDLMDTKRLEQKSECLLSMKTLTKEAAER